MTIDEKSNLQNAIFQLHLSLTIVLLFFDRKTAVKRLAFFVGSSLNNVVMSKSVKSINIYFEKIIN